MPLPIPRPISGRRFAPKIRMMIMRMMMSSGIPTLPSMVMPFADTGRRNSTTFALVAAVLLGWGILARAQFTSGVNVVEVYTAVLDQNGNPVTGLARGDFTVLEDGRAQTIATFAEADFPLAVVVAVDRSFSMA